MLFILFRGQTDVPATRQKIAAPRRHQKPCLRILPAGAMSHYNKHIILFPIHKSYWSSFKHFCQIISITTFFRI